ncbi:GLI pathogenesis-related 2 [Alosa pseudoharengus]|uniref:GLI pathogenesis-related 2 n=1 Tax=Alosa pseudoharengus TaxID=34774 RepID=UPI003F8CC1FF
MAGSAFEKEFLEAHNTYRQRHGAAPLTLNKDLSRSAQKWAEYLLASKKMQHSQADYGENLYYAWSSAPKQLKGKEAVDNWYNEIKDYSFSKPGFQSNTGHFTQVVWKGSEKLGVGLATDGKTTFVVGQYLPAGNISNPGYFEKNVLPAGSSVGKHADAGAASGGNDRGSLPSRQSGSDHNSSSLTGSAFEKETLEAHNTYRQRHGAAPLTLNKDLSRSAQKWAEYLLASKKMQHSQADYGENLYYAWSSAPKQLKGKEAVDSWYNEIKNYSFSRPGFQSNTGHFTQVVWKGSEKLGVGLATDGKTTFVVCQYLPAGNISNPGYFEKNVLPAGSSVGKHADAGAASGGNDRGIFPLRKSGSDHNSSSLTGAGGKNSEFSLSALDTMNGYRRQHRAKPLSLCPSLSKEAQEWADFLLKSKMLRNHGKGHGESLWYQSGSSVATPKGSDVVKSWYEESSKYNFSSPGFQRGTGNFTQMVWKSSEKVGVAIATNGSGLFFSVAFFEPPGNVSNTGYFRDNVSAKS